MGFLWLMSGKDNFTSYHIIILDAYVNIIYVLVFSGQDNAASVLGKYIV